MVTSQFATLMNGKYNGIKSNQTKEGNEEKRMKGAKVDHRACKVSHALILSKWVISHSCTQSSYGDSQSTWHLKEVAHSCGRRPLELF